jgi:glycosyltransferase involved in cell wall biosynthesis
MIGSVSVIVLTHDEERNIAACLASVASWAPVFVVDSGSTDTTADIARQHGATVVVHPFESHARQWNWALRTLPLATEWALCLDADHVVTPELREAILTAVSQDGPELDGVDGFYVTRRQMFRGQWIRHGGYYPKPLLKLLRHRCAWSDETELLDFRFYVRGRTRALVGDLVEDNRNESDIGFWLTKHIRFARLQASEELARATSSTWSVRPTLFGTPDQRVLWLKARWYRLPLFARPFVYFFYRYVLRLGFLDGKAGLVFHFLQAFWYRFVVDVMLDDLRRSGRRRTSSAAHRCLDSKQAR